MGPPTSAGDQSHPIGIVGSGHAGQALARTALRAGREVIVANRRGPESLASVVTALGAGVAAVTVTEAVGCAMVALAVPWASVPAAVEGQAWAGRIVVDATNALRFPDLQPLPLDGRTSSEIVAELVPGARLVKQATRWRPRCWVQIPVLRAAAVSSSSPVTT